MIWKKIRYACYDVTVSSSGHIIYNGKFLKQWGRPYKQVRIRHTNFKVHMIIAKAFSKGYKKGLVVNHNNGNKSDNRAKNLLYCTQEDNIRHAHRTGLVPYRKRQ